MEQNPNPRRGEDVSDEQIVKAICAAANCTRERLVDAIIKAGIEECEKEIVKRALK